MKRSAKWTENSKWTGNYFLADIPLIKISLLFQSAWKELEIRENSENPSAKNLNEKSAK